MSPANLNLTDFTSASVSHFPKIHCTSALKTAHHPTNLSTLRTNSEIPRRVIQLERVNTQCSRCWCSWLIQGCSSSGARVTSARPPRPSHNITSIRPRPQSTNTTILKNLYTASQVPGRQQVHIHVHQCRGTNTTIWGFSTSRISSRTQVCIVFYNMPSFVIGAIGEVLARATLARHTETEATSAASLVAAAAVGGGAATAWGYTGAKVP